MSRADRKTAMASWRVRLSGGRNAPSRTPHRPRSFQSGTPISVSSALRSRYTFRGDIATRFAISAGRTPSSPCACSTERTRNSRAERSRLPSIRSSCSGSIALVIARWTSGRRDADRAAAVGCFEAQLDRRLDGVVGDVDRIAIDPANHTSELAVGEHPVVELAAEPGKVGVADEQRHLRYRGPERRSVDGDPAVLRAGAVEDVDPVSLRNGSVAGAERGPRELAVEVTVTKCGGVRRLPVAVPGEGPRVAIDHRSADLAQLPGTRDVAG